VLVVVSWHARIVMPTPTTTIAARICRVAVITTC
jgi:hypothetical protein